MSGEARGARTSRASPITAAPASNPVAVCSFPPIQNRAARVLILGSMPGAASLRARRYYAYEHNAFWKIMGALFDAGPDVAYEKRVATLKRAGVAVWDVLESCVREGSLDSSIDEASMVPNDFQAFLRRIRASVMSFSTAEWPRAASGATCARNCQNQNCALRVCRQPVRHTLRGISKPSSRPGAQLRKRWRRARGERF